MININESVQYYLRNQGYSEDQARQLCLAIDEKLIIIVQDKIENEGYTDLQALIHGFNVAYEHYGLSVSLCLIIKHSQTLNQLDIIAEANKHLARHSAADSPYIDAARAYVQHMPPSSPEPPSEFEPPSV